MRVLALDLSTHTGWAVLESPGNLVEFGAMTMTELPESFPRGYPINYILATEKFAAKLNALVEEKKPDVIVIEETVPGQETYSQKILGFIHCTLLQEISDANIVYLRTGEWRKTIELRMSKADLKGNQKKNLVKAKSKAAALRKQIKKLGSGKKNKEQVAELKEELRSLQLGKVTRKHLSVRKSNEIFNLDLKLQNNDEADAILLGLAYLRGAQPCDGKRPTVKKVVS